LYYSLEGDVPSGMSIDSSGLITWDPVPCPSEGPNWMVTVKVTDACDAEDTVTLRATAKNTAPEILNITNTVTLAVPPVEQYNGSAIATCDATYQVEASDPDACQTELYYSLEGDVPSGMSIDSSGLITWDPVPCPSEGPTWMVTVKVKDACDAEDTVTLRATAKNAAPTITSVEFTNEFMVYPCDRCNCTCVVLEDSKTLHIKVTAEDLDDCQTLTYSLNTDACDLPLPPQGLTYEQVGDEFEIAFNANCYDQCIDCEPPPDGDIRGLVDYICDCWWEFMIRVTDGCETVDVCIRVCVADIINN